jgi:hypothetical protein
MCRFFASPCKEGGSVLALWRFCHDAAERSESHQMTPTRNPTRYSPGPTRERDGPASQKSLSAPAPASRETQLTDKEGSKKLGGGRELSSRTSLT